MKTMNKGRWIAILLVFILSFSFLPMTASADAGDADGNGGGTRAMSYSVTINPTEHGTVTAEPNSRLNGGERITLTIAPDEGYKLKDIGVKIKNNGTPVDYYEDTRTFTMPPADVVVDATFEKIPHIVTFNLNSGNDEYFDQIVEHGDKAKKPEDPTRAGYTFVCWTLNGEEFNFETVITTGIVLFAKWEKKDEHTVTFNSNGGSAVPAQTVDHGGKATKPEDPTREGHTFAGWYWNNDEFDFDSEIMEDITLTAKWNENDVHPDPINIYVITYYVVSGADGTWMKDSNNDYEIVIKRSRNDEQCFSHFMTVQVDGVTLVKGVDFEAKAGSTVINFKPLFLKKLSLGKHTVLAKFDDGKAETTLTVEAVKDGQDDNGDDNPGDNVKDNDDGKDNATGKGNSNNDGSNNGNLNGNVDKTNQVPKTGDSAQFGLWIMMMLASLAGLGGMFVYGSKKQ